MKMDRLLFKKVKKTAININIFLNKSPIFQQ